MKLNELTNDSTLQLEFEAGQDKLYLDVQIAQVSKGGLVLYPVITFIVGLLEAITALKLACAFRRTPWLYS